MNSVLAIGPANYAGQANRWVKAVRQQLGMAAWSFSGAELRGGGYSFEVDRRLGRFAFRNPMFWAARARRMFAETTHLALDGFKSFARWDLHAAFAADARRLEKMGKKMALIAHGSDVRDPAAHLARDELSYFSVGDDDWRRMLSNRSARNRAFAAESGWPVFFSTPDLAFDLPFGTWLPVVVDVDAWASNVPLLERAKPRVLHIPSQRNPPIKGTELIMPVLQRLERAGAIEVIAPAGLPHDQLRKLVMECDVVVDQLLFGSYGVAAVEAMAAGRVTVGRMIDAVREKMTEAPEMLEATPDTLYEVLSSIRDRRDELRSQALRGVKFARKWHDGAESARRMADFLGHLVG